LVRVLIYTARACPYCRLAEKLLEKKGVQAEKVMVDEAPEQRREMTRITGCTSVPQIFIGATHVGGYTDLAALDMKGELDPLLQSA
jgi:glutaredoxin 3